MRVVIKRTMMRGVWTEGVSVGQKWMRVVIKWTMVRGLERGAFCWRRKKDECGYKMDYGERGGESGCFC